MSPPPPIDLKRADGSVACRLTAEKIVSAGGGRLMCRGRVKVSAGNALAECASLLAMARESEEGEVLVAPPTTIALTKMLYVHKEWWEKKDDYHCERRPSSPVRGLFWGWG